MINLNKIWFILGKDRLKRYLPDFNSNHFKHVLLCMIQAELNVVFVCSAQSFAEPADSPQWWVLTSTVNIHVGESLRSGQGRAADGLTCVDRCLYPGRHVWISPNCENSISWQSVDVHRALSKTGTYQNLRACVTARLGLFTEVQPAGTFAKVCFETPSINW